MVEFMEQGTCAQCGSLYVVQTAVEKDVNVLVWYRCRECGCEFVEMYEYSCKGVLIEEEE